MKNWLAKFVPKKIEEAEVTRNQLFRKFKENRRNRFREKKSQSRKIAFLGQKSPKKSPATGPVWDLERGKKIER